MKQAKPSTAAAHKHPTSPDSPDFPNFEGQPALSRGRKITRFLSLTFATLFFLLFFSLFKLPEDKLRNWLDGNIAVTLARKGISYSATKKSLSFFLGPTYRATDVTVGFPPPSPSGHLDEISISPAVFPLILGRYGGNAEIRNKNGELRLTASLQNPTSGPTPGLKGTFSFDSRKMDLGKTNLFPGLTGLQIASALFDGQGALKGDLTVPSTLEGSMKIRLSPLILDAQTILGFSVPKLSISEGNIEVNLEKNKALFKNFKLGKPGNSADDIQGSISGNITLNKTWESSLVNLKINFTLSENVKKAFILLDTLLAEYKQGDGSYTLELTGPLLAPLPSSAASAAPTNPSAPVSGGGST